MAGVEPHSARWVIWCDFQITRRKRYHAVKDGEGRWCYESRLFWECVEYLDALGVTEYELRAGAVGRNDQVAALIVRKVP